MKKILIVLLIMTLLAGVCVQAADRKLTLDRAVAISDTQIILEFSEPIAINKFDSNYGPYISVRLVNSSGGVVRIMDDKSPYYGTYLQWTGNTQYVDRKHDRVLFTMFGSVFGVDTLSGIMNYDGMLSEFSEYKVAIVVEEVPYDTAGHYGDNQVCNITTRDGEICLTPTRHTGYESCVLPIEVNYGYKVDLSMVEGTAEKAEPVSWGYSLVTLADGTEQFEIEEEATPVIDVKKNDPIIVLAILGGSALICAALIVISVIMKRKAVS